MPPATDSRPWLRIIVAALFGAAAILYALTWSYYGHRGAAAFLGVEAHYNVQEGEYHVTAAVDGGPASRAGLRAEDRIVAVDGQALETPNPFFDHIQRGRPGDVVPLTVRRGDQVLQFQVTLVAPPAEGASAFARLLLLPLSLYPVPFFVVGLTVLAMRVRDRNAWLLALAFAGLGTGPYTVFEPIVHPTLRGFMMAFSLFMSGVSPSLFYMLLATFPAPSPIDRRLPWLKKLLVTGAVVYYLPQAAWTFIDGSWWPMFRVWRPLISPPAGYVVSTYAFGAFGLGLASLLLNVRYADGEARRKARMILASFVVFVPWLCLSIGALALGRNPMTFRVWVWAPCALLLMLSPVLFGYAVVRHRVLEFSVLVRRSARYVLVQRGFVLLVIVLSVLITLGFALVIARVLPRFTDTALPAGIALGTGFGLVLVRTGGAFARTVAHRIDRAFFRGAYDARRILEDLAQRTGEVTSREELSTLLERELDGALHPRHLVICLADQRGELRVHAAAGRPSRHPALDRDAFAAFFGSRQGAREFTPDDAAAHPALAALEPDCAVPIWNRRHALIGALVLGMRLSEEPYSREDRTLLTSIASQAGSALENLMLAEDMARRIEAERVSAREFEIAADVQRRLLPARSVALDTIDYVGRCVQARAVGGDYYDFLDLGPGMLGLVLADISGKGLYAALLMANLQASLRSLSARLATEDLPSLLAGVDRSFSESTALNHFATLFVGLYDDATGRLRYVNCGHLPPVVMRGNGEIERLDVSAGAIGFLDEWRGEMREVALAPDDIVVLFTDGVTEALNEQGEEFGEARLLATLATHRQQPLPEFLDRVMADVRAFGGREQSDDCTLVLVRAHAAIQKAAWDPASAGLTSVRRSQSA